MGTKSTQEAGAEYTRIRAEYHANAWLYGTVTIKEFIGGRKPELYLAPEVPDGDFVAEKNVSLYICFHRHTGEIGWKSGIF